MTGLLVAVERNAPERVQGIQEPQCHVVIEVTNIFDNLRLDSMTVVFQEDLYLHVSVCVPLFHPSREFSLGVTEKIKQIGLYVPWKLVRHVNVDFPVPGITLGVLNAEVLLDSGEIDSEYDGEVRIWSSFRGRRRNLWTYP